MGASLPGEHAPEPYCSSSEALAPRAAPQAAGHSTRSPASASSASAPPQGATVSGAAAGALSWPSRLQPPSPAPRWCSSRAG